jgi:hypothetical protein
VTFCWNEQLQHDNDVTAGRAITRAMIETTGGIYAVAAALNRAPSYVSKLSEAVNGMNEKHVQLAREPGRRRDLGVLVQRHLRPQAARVARAADDRGGAAGERRGARRDGPRRPGARSDRREARPGEVVRPFTGRWLLRQHAANQHFALADAWLAHGTPRHDERSPREVTFGGRWRRTTRLSFMETEIGGVTASLWFR